MIQAVSFILTSVALAVVFGSAPAPAKVVVKNYATGASLAFPALKESPSTPSAEEPDKPIEIQSGRIVAHNGKKFMCGIAAGNKRYVVALNACFEWQAVEPGADDSAWHRWLATYEEICDGNSAR